MGWRKQRLRRACLNSAARAGDGYEADVQDEALCQSTELGPAVEPRLDELGSVVAATDAAVRTAYELDQLGGVLAVALGFDAQEGFVNG